LALVRDRVLAAGCLELVQLLNVHPTNLGVLNSVTVHHVHKIRPADGALLRINVLKELNSVNVLVLVLHVGNLVHLLNVLKLAAVLTS